MLLSSSEFHRHARILRRQRIKRQAQRELMQRYMQRAEKCRQLNQLDTFHCAIKPYLCVAQCCGLMPLTNILSSNPKDIAFRMNSRGTLITIILSIIYVLRALNVTMDLLAVGVNMKNMVGIVFFWGNILTLINFIALARDWPRLIVSWNKVDILMLYPPYENPHQTMRSKLRVLGSWFAGLALIDHILYHASNYYNYRMRIEHCKLNNSKNFIAYVESNFSGSIFGWMSDNIAFSFFGMVVNFAFTIIWNSMDIMIMAISIGLQMRFQQFAERVQVLSGHNIPDAIWYDIRQDHIQLCELLDHVNSAFSNIILFSCLHNIYFICAQLLNIFTKLRYPINYVYFWYSLIFLLGRSASVFLSASKVHDASVLPLQTIYLVRSADWSEEVQRFFQQLTSEFIGISGHRLFYLTRQSFFGLMAALVTYEFMLLQFDAKTRETTLPDLCV